MLNASLKKYAKKFGEFVYRNFEKDSGNMILYTSIIGISLSVIAQTAAIFINKKYSLSQKAFMIPQEITEGVMTVASLFFVSKPLQQLAKKMTKTGKIISKDLKQYLKNNNFTYELGRYNYNIDRNMDIILNNKLASVKNSDNLTKQDIRTKHSEILSIYHTTSDATAAISTTIGSVLTTALISPFIKNLSASHYQKVNMDLYDNIKERRNKQLNTCKIYNSSFNSNNSSLKI